jgi:hypothetical protein
VNFSENRLKRDLPVPVHTHTLISMQVSGEMLTQANQDNSLCRVCLTVDYNNQCIFRKNWNDSDDTSNSELSKKLQLCGGIEVCFFCIVLMFSSNVIILHRLRSISFLKQVLEEDGLPTSICIKCVMKVNVAYELREQCQRADTELRRLYGKALKKNIGNYIYTKVIIFLSISKMIISTLFRLLIISLFLCRINIAKLNNFASWIQSNRKII